MFLLPLEYFENLSRLLYIHTLLHFGVLVKKTNQDATILLYLDNFIFMSYTKLLYNEGENVLSPN